MSSSPDDVHELDSTTLRPFVDAHDVVLLAILMLPQSERCQKMVGVVQSMAASSTNEQVAFAQINVNGNWDAVSSFGITTYPHLMIFRGYEDWRVYRGAFTKASIESYVDRFVRFLEITRVDARSLGEFKKSSEVVVVGHINSDDPTCAARFEDLAKALHPEIVFGITDNADHAREERIDAPAIVVYNNGTDERCTLPIVEDLEEMKLSVRKAALPLIVDLYPETHEDLLDLGTPFAYIFTPTPTSDFNTPISSLARRYRGRIRFSITPPTRVPSIVEDMHLDPSSPSPTFAIREPISNLRYPMPSTSPSTSIPSFIGAVETFVESYLAGTLQPTIKSEPIPPPSSSALVKVFGLTYDAIVNNPTRDVLLVVCIEKCGPCHRLYPVLEDLGEAYRLEEVEKDRKEDGDDKGEGRVNGKERKTTIATLLYDKNDTSLRGVRAFPTILMFAARKKRKPVRYLGARTVEGLRGFIEENGSF